MSGNLPVTYQQARSALAKCASVDECKDWADKAAALASYAKQADDVTLENNSKRIKARAIDRMGELMAEIPEQPGKRTDLQLGGGAPTRTEICREAGISKDQQVTAMRVHAVPRDVFEKRVESDSPPTITELASLARQSMAGQIVETFRDIQASHADTAGLAQLKSAWERATALERIKFLNWIKSPAAPQPAEPADDEFIDEDNDGRGVQLKAKTKRKPK
jgi:hypothetical protein